jgi:hypothetical protein
MQSKLNSNVKSDYGLKKPQKSKRNSMIHKAIKRAVKDYRKTFDLLAGS